MPSSSGDGGEIQHSTTAAQMRGEKKNSRRSEIRLRYLDVCGIFDANDGTVGGCVEMVEKRRGCASEQNE